ncbi:MAG: methionyl-tRNA formyltransferase, partial [Clostridium sp.]
GYTLTPPPVKECALSHGITVYQPTTMKDGQAAAQLRELDPECIVVVAYGKILPQEIIHLPEKGCINVHASLLPRYRGAAPIQWSVINGEKKSGVTTMCMDEGIDTGDMLLKEECVIPPDMTAGELHDKLSVLGAELIVKTLEQLEKGEITKEKQNDSLSCRAPMLDKKLSWIDWHKTAQEVHNLIRGLQPWPVAQTKWMGKTLKIHKSRLSDKKGKQPGTVLSQRPFVVCCGDGASIEILEVQLEGKKRMSAEDFFRGHPIELSTTLGI